MPESHAYHVISTRMHPIGWQSLAHCGHFKNVSTQWFPRGWSHQWRWYAWTFVRSDIAFTACCYHLPSVFPRAQTWLAARHFHWNIQKWISTVSIHWGMLDWQNDMFYLRFLKFTSNLTFMVLFSHYPERANSQKRLSVFDRFENIHESLRTQCHGKCISVKNIRNLSGVGSAALGRCWQKEWCARCNNTKRFSVMQTFWEMRKSKSKSKPNAKRSKSNDTYLNFTSRKTHKQMNRTVIYVNFW